MSLSDFLFEKTPWWIAMIILTILGLVKFGPKFLREWGNTLRDLRKKGLESEYITDLKMQRDRLLKEVEELKRELKHKDK